jgi:glutathione S-transferase
MMPGSADAPLRRPTTRAWRTFPCIIHAMSRPKLTYFDAPVSRGEECRLALHIAGVDFEDVRIDRAAWLAMKPTAPYGGLPILDLPGSSTLAHSNAILVYVGRRWGLHPKDDFEAAQHEGMMQHVEDLRAGVTPTLRMTDEAEKKKARVALVAGFLPTWAANAEKNITSDGPFFAGSDLHVVDVKIHMAVRWFAGGKVDYVPPTIFSAYPRITRVHDAVRDDARVKAWYAKG